MRESTKMFIKLSILCVGSLATLLGVTLWLGESP